MENDKETVEVRYEGWLLFAPIYLKEVNEQDQEIFAKKYFACLLTLALFTQQILNVFVYFVNPDAVGFALKVRKLKQPKTIEVYDF